MIKYQPKLEKKWLKKNMKKQKKRQKQLKQNLKETDYLQMLKVKRNQHISQPEKMRLKKYEFSQKKLKRRKMANFRNEELKWKLQKR